MNKLYFFIFIACLGCSEATKIETVRTVKSNTPVESVRELKLSFFNSSTFLNGDEILHANTDELWTNAANDGIPAWCYSNDIETLGEKVKLYNYYAFNDKRGLLENVQQYNHAELKKLFNELDGLNYKLSIVNTIERNFKGNYFNLQLLNCWIINEDVDSNSVRITSWDPETNLCELHPVDKGNGFPILDLKL